jgi:hypothetical protein
VFDDLQYGRKLCGCARPGRYESSSVTKGKSEIRQPLSPEGSYLLSQISLLYYCCFLTFLVCDRVRLTYSVCLLNSTATCSPADSAVVVNGTALDTAINSSELLTLYIINILLLLGQQPEIHQFNMIDSTCELKNTSSRMIRLTAA